MSFYNSRGNRKEYAISFSKECGHERRLSDKGKHVREILTPENLAGGLPTCGKTLIYHQSGQARGGGKDELMDSREKD